jgi:hypothetical protein
MSSTYMQRYSANVLQPAQNPQLARTDAVAIAASQTIAAGTVLGEVGNVNATSTITISAGTSGGTFKLTTTTAPTTAQTGAITWSGTNATLLANIQTALNAAYGTTGGNPNVVASAVSLTAGIGTILLTAQNAWSGQPIAWTLQDSTTGGSGTTVASTTTGVVPSGTFKAYSATATDGSQVPKCIAQCDMVTDSANPPNITLGGQAGGGEFGQTQLTAPVYTSGYFFTSDLVGLDTNAISLLGGHLVRGSAGSGENGIFAF